MIDSPLRQLLDKVNAVFVDLENDWLESGYQIFSLEVDLFSWKKHGDRHRIHYLSKPLVEQSYPRRIEAIKKIDLLTNAVHAEADRITAELLALLPEEGNK